MRSMVCRLMAVRDRSEWVSETSAVGLYVGVSVNNVSKTTRGCSKFAT